MTINIGTLGIMIMAVCALCIYVFFTYTNIHIYLDCVESVFNNTPVLKGRWAFDCKLTSDTEFNKYQKGQDYWEFWIW